MMNPSVMRIRGIGRYGVPTFPTYKTHAHICAATAKLRTLEVLGTEDLIGKPNPQYISFSFVSMYYTK